MVNLENLKIIDISPLVHEQTAVFPGDTAFSRQETLSYEKGHNLRLSSMKTTLHIGAHTDAPSHYHPHGMTMEKRSLDFYLGPCQVIEVICPQGERIKLEHLQSEIKSQRILFKTGSFPDPDQWNDDFNSLSIELLKSLHSMKVKLVGIDTPSVDPADDKNLLCHNFIFQNDMAILEGIVLDHVEAGNYQLIALPLKLERADASPVRAVLIES